MGTLYFGSQKVLPVLLKTTATISSLTVSPSTTSQTITASGGTDGYSPITVNAVTYSIDPNIVASNIKSGVSILGVSGSVVELAGETRSVSINNKNGNTFTPNYGKNGITSITVTPTNQAKTITPTTSSQSISVPSGYSGFGDLTVDAVTASIDANITAGNIKDGVTILGVTGTYAGGSGYSELPPYEVSNGVATRRSGALTGNEFSNITSVGDNGLRYAFYGCSGLTGNLNLSSLTSVGNYGFQYAFYGCFGLTGNLNLSSLTSVGNYGFQYAFHGCTGLTGVNLSSLTTIGNFGFSYAFYSCPGLTDIYFNSLTTTSFGSYTTQLMNMLYYTGTSTTHTLHFPSNLESTIQDLTGYPTFGGTSGYVVLSFDLPATS